MQGNKKIIKIWFDLFHFGERNILAENNEVEIPWNLLGKYGNKRQINGANVNVPSLELLLVYKVKALHDREYKLKRLLMSGIAGERGWLRGKIRKDMQDIRDILQTGKINEGVLDEILETTKFREYYEKAMRRFR